jgi:hypothetical protein
MAGRDPYLTRINRALRDLGSSVSLEVSPSGAKLRLLSAALFHNRKLHSWLPSAMGIADDPLR